MQQLEIKYFWPLTEQVPLDLDYSDCNKPALSIPATGSTGFTIASNGNWATTTTTLTASNLSIDIDTTVIKVKEEPNLCRKLLYRCLGLKWEKK